jgi:phytoene desaturase
MGIKILGRDYQSHYDAIIVGAGIGGLFCANLLADAGMKVLVVEQHYVLGGYCSSFRKKGFLFDSATHFYPLLGNPTTLTGKLLKRLNVHTRWHKMDPVDKFHFPDDETFVVPADLSDYLQRLKSRFPHQAENIERFFGEVREAYLYGLLYYFKEISHETAEKYRDFTLARKLDEHFQDPRLKANLMADHSHWGSLPGHTSFLFDSMLRLSYFLGNYYPIGSSQAFADDLGEALRSRGGDILLYTQVEKILIEKERVQGIVCRTRSRRNPQRFEFRAPVVVSNADVLQTYERLVGEAYCGTHVIDGLRTLRPSFPCYLMHMGLKELSHELKEEIEGYYWRSWDPEDLQHTFFKIFFTTMFDPSLAPPGHDILIVQKWGTSNFDQIGDWAAHKRETEDYILSQLRRLIPGLDDKIVVQMSATAHTSYRYTLNFRGAMLGWEMSPDQLGPLRPSNKTPIDNLYLVGHWTRPGGGITPVIVSAQRVADLILSRQQHGPIARQQESNPASARPKSWRAV